MSIFVTGETGFIYSNFVYEWTYRSDESAIGSEWSIQNELTLSAEDQQAIFLTEVGQIA